MLKLVRMCSRWGVVHTPNSLASVTKCRATWFWWWRYLRQVLRARHWRIHAGGGVGAGAPTLRHSSHPNYHDFLRGF